MFKDALLIPFHGFDEELNKIGVQAGNLLFYVLSRIEDQVELLTWQTIGNATQSFGEGRRQLLMIQYSLGAVSRLFECNVRVAYTTKTNFIVPQASATYSG